MTRDEPKAAVVIPTFNQADSLAATLDSLVAQRWPATDFEVIVADDGSSDRTAEVARSYADRLRLQYCFQPDEGFRASAARNLGARLSSAAVLIFLDTGTLAGPDLVRGHWELHSESEQRRAVIGYTYGYQPWETGVELIDALGRLTPEQVVARFEGQPWLRDWRHDLFDPARVDVSALAAPWLLYQGMNCSVGAEDFHLVGGYDEDFRHWGVDDLEFGFRLFERGVEFTVGVGAWAMEVPGPRDMEFRLRDAKHNGWYFLGKHPQPVSEIFWRVLLDEEIWPVEPEYQAVLDWTDQVRDLDVQAEIAHAIEEFAMPDARVAVFGCGARLPSSMRVVASTALVDFDRTLLDQAAAGHPCRRQHGIGLRTAMADGSHDLVVITSRLAGLWPRWGEHILTEARRLAPTVIRAKSLS